MDYILIASLLLYAFVARGTINHSLGILFPSLIVTLIPAGLHAAFTAIITSSMPNTSVVETIFTWPFIIQTVVQFVLAYFTFLALRRFDETIAAWYCTLLAGGAVIYFAVPFVVSRLLG